MYLIIAYTLWYAFWYVYNFILLQKGIATETHPRITSGIYLTLTFIFLSLSGLVNFYFLFWILLLFIVGALVVYLYPNRYLGRLSNALFQIIWLYVITVLGNFNILMVGILFLIGHLPIIFVTHLKVTAKVLILVTSLFLGLIYATFFTYIFSPLHLLICIIFHVLVYEIVRPIDKKFKLNIIN